MTLALSARLVVGDEGGRLQQVQFPCVLTQLCIAGHRAAAEEEEARHGAGERRRGGAGHPQDGARVGRRLRLTQRGLPCRLLTRLSSSFQRSSDTKVCFGGRSFRSATQGLLTGKRTHLPVILLMELGQFSTAMTEVPHATAVC